MEKNVKNYNTRFYQNLKLHALHIRLHPLSRSVSVTLTFLFYAPGVVVITVVVGSTDVVVASTVVVVSGSVLVVTIAVVVASVVLPVSSSRVINNEQLIGFNMENVYNRTYTNTSIEMVYFDTSYHRYFVQSINIVV